MVYFFCDIQRRRKMLKQTNTRNSLINKIVHTLWGGLHGAELKKYILLAIGFFFLIGPYWILKILKDIVFINTVGAKFIPDVKNLSLILTLPLVLIYSKLVDIMSKERMIYAMIFVYGSLGLLFVYFLQHPTIGVANEVTDPTRLMGWFFCLYVDSFISLMLALYWSFINDIATPESAERGYALVIFGSQFGGLIFIIIGQLLSHDPTHYTTSVPLLALIAVLSLIIIAPLTYFLHKTVGNNGLQSYEDRLNLKQEKTKVGFFEGLKVILTHPYVLGIFGLIVFHEFISTLMNYQMARTLEATFSDKGVISKWMFEYGVSIQIIASLFALLGTSYFQRKLGTRFCIIAYPLLLGTSIVWYLYNPNLHTIFCVMLIAKAINLAFNQPVKEVLYIPTSKNIKYKSKIWIDMFGLRFAKAAGSSVNKVIGASLSGCSIVALPLIGIWIFLGNTIGRYYQKTIDNKKLID